MKNQDETILEELKEWKDLAARFTSVASGLAWAVICNDKDVLDQANDAIDTTNEYLVFVDRE